VVSIASDDLASAVRGRSFETIVTTGPRAPDGDFFDHVGELAPSIEDGGTLITEINGWPRTTGMTDLVGLERGSAMAGDRSPATVWRSIPSRLVAVLEDRGSTRSNCSGCSPVGGDTGGRCRSPTPTPSSGCWTRSRQTRRPLGCSGAVRPSPTG